MDDFKHALNPEDLLSQAGRLHAIARRLLGDSHAAEDLVQDTWVAALQVEAMRTEDLQQGEGWRAWLAGVTRNLSLRRVRREAQRRALEREVAPAEAVGGMEGVADRLQLQRDLADAILELDEPYRSALVLRYLESLPHAEVAKRQGVSPANARKRVSRALEMLRARMGVEVTGNGHGEKGVLAALFGIRDWLTNWWDIHGLGASGATGVTAQLGLGGMLVGTKTWIGAVAVAVGIAFFYTRTAGEMQLGQAEPHAPELSLAREHAPLDRSATLPDSSPGTPVAAAGNSTNSVRVDSGLQEQMVRGVVTDTQGKPLGGVTVRWFDRGTNPLVGPQNFTTGVEGEFWMSQPEGGEALLFECDRFESHYRALGPERDLQAQLEVALLAKPRVEGSVRNSNGDLVAPPGAVTLSVRHAPGDYVQEFKAKVGDDGRYYFDDLPVGTLVKIEARARGFDRYQEEVETTLVADNRYVVDVALPPGLTIVGTVRDSVTLLPVPFAKVWSKDFKYDENSIKPSTIADSEGRFRLTGVEREEHVTDGGSMFMVWLVGESPDHSSTLWNPAFVMCNEASECSLDLKLVPSSCSLRVVLYEPGGVQVASGVEVWIVDAERNFAHHVTNEKGELDFEGLPPGKVGLHAFRRYVNAVGSHDSLVVEIDLEPGTHDRVELVMYSDPDTSIGGRVTNTEGLPLAGVELIAHYDLHFSGLSFPLDSAAQTTDAAGNYRFEKLRAGRYRIDTPNCTSPTRLKLDVGRNEVRSDFDIVLGECMVVSGRVDLGGKSPRELRVRLFDPKSNVELESRGLDESGKFQFTDLLEGTYEVGLFEEDLELDRTTAKPSQASGLRLRRP